MGASCHACQLHPQNQPEIRHTSNSRVNPHSLLNESSQIRNRTINQPAVIQATSNLTTFNSGIGSMHSGNIQDGVVCRMMKSHIRHKTFSRQSPFALSGNLKTKKLNENQVEYLIEPSEQNQAAEKEKEQEQIGKTQEESVENPQPVSNIKIQRHRIKRESFVRMLISDVNKKYIFLQRLGQGAFGSVFVAKSKTTGEQRAIKIISKSKIIQIEQNLLSELMILRTLDHPNILKLHEVYDNGQHYYVVTEICRGGDLLQYSKNKSTITEQYVSSLMKQLLSAVNYLHKLSIVHRDLKPQNIMFEEVNTNKGSNNIKIIDFGMAAYIPANGCLTDRVGSPYYVAPEVLNQTYNQKCDIWSCGVIMYVLLCGAPPFPGRNRQDIFNNILNTKLNFRELAWKKVSPSAKDMVRKMLDKNPQKRPSAEQLLQHCWIQENEENNQSHEKAFSNQVLKNMENFFFKDRFKAVVMTYIGSLVTSAKDKKTLAEKFKELDKDNSGMLERDELVEAYTYMHGAISQEYVDQIMSKIDTNGSGKIDYTQFIVAVTAPDRSLCTAHLETAFNYFDKDGTGFLQVCELKDLIGSGDNQQQEREIQRIMLELDSNKDNKISKEEFVNNILGQVV